MDIIQLLAKHRRNDGRRRNPDLLEIGLGVGDPDEQHLGGDGPSRGRRVHVEENRRDGDVHVREERQATTCKHVVGERRRRSVCPAYLVVRVWRGKEGAVGGVCAACPAGPVAVYGGFRQGEIDATALTATASEPLRYSFALESGLDKDHLAVVVRLFRVGSGVRTCVDNGGNQGELLGGSAQQQPHINCPERAQRLSELVDV